jgi:hypothetical protein
MDGGFPRSGRKWSRLSNALLVGSPSKQEALIMNVMSCKAQQRCNKESDSY